MPTLFDGGGRRPAATRRLANGHSSNGAEGTPGAAEYSFPPAPPPAGADGGDATVPRRFPAAFLEALLLQCLEGDRLVLQRALDLPTPVSPTVAAAAGSELAGAGETHFAGSSNNTPAQSTSRPHHGLRARRPANIKLLLSPLSPVGAAAGGGEPAACAGARTGSGGGTGSSSQRSGSNTGTPSSRSILSPAVLGKIVAQDDESRSPPTRDDDEDGYWGHHPFQQQQHQQAALPRRHRRRSGLKPGPGRDGWRGAQQQLWGSNERPGTSGGRGGGCVGGGGGGGDVDDADHEGDDGSGGGGSEDNDDNVSPPITSAWGGGGGDDRGMGDGNGDGGGDDDVDADSSGDRASGGGHAGLGNDGGGTAADDSQSGSGTQTSQRRSRAEFASRAEQRRGLKAAGRWAPGDVVQVRWRGWSKWVPALVLAAHPNGTYDLVSDEGNTEKAVRPGLLRPHPAEEGEGQWNTEHGAEGEAERARKTTTKKKKKQQQQQKKKKTKKKNKNQKRSAAAANAARLPLKAGSTGWQRDHAQRVRPAQVTMTEEIGAGDDGGGGGGGDSDVDDEEEDEDEDEDEEDEDDEEEEAGEGTDEDLSPHKRSRRGRQPNNRPGRGAAAGSNGDPGVPKQGNQHHTQKRRRQHQHQHAAAAEEEGEGKDGLFIVDHIRAHRVDRRGNVQFLVKWEGFPDSENTWEPTANLRQNQAITDYFASGTVRKFMKLALLRLRRSS